MIHVIYTINYLIAPNPSIELIIGVLYLFLRRCAFVTGDRKFRRNWVKNKWKFIGSHKWKALLRVWLWASHGLNPGPSHAVSFSPSLDFALALFSCIFSHGDKTATTELWATQTQWYSLPVSKYVLVKVLQRSRSNMYGYVQTYL